MKTVVYQSFRTDDVPRGMARCLDSVADWAERRGYAYRFLDDALFDRVPAWFRARVGGNPLPMSDLARLKVAREWLAAGFERAVWLDADVLVFDPDAFDVAHVTDYAFGREIWVRRGRDAPLVTEGLHNAICVLCRGNQFLDFYIHACEEIVRAAETDVLSHQIGPDFLNRLRDVIGGRIIPDMGLFSPLVMTDIANGGGPALTAYKEAFGHSVRAANLCLSFVDRESSGVTVTGDVFERAIDRLIDTRGQVVNGEVSAPAGAKKRRSG